MEKKYNFWRFKVFSRRSTRARNNNTPKPNLRPRCSRHVPVQQQQQKKSYPDPSWRIVPRGTAARWRPRRRTRSSRRSRTRQGRRRRPGRRSQAARRRRRRRRERSTPTAAGGAEVSWWRVESSAKTEQNVHQTVLICELLMSTKSQPILVSLGGTPSAATIVVVSHGVLKVCCSNVFISLTWR